MSYLDLIPLAHSNGSSAGNSFVARWAQICQENETRRQQWIANLRECGVVAARPDDGWINRRKNTVNMNAYPDFNDGLYEGCIVALGTCEKHRLVKLLRYEPLFLDPSMGSWYFEDVNANVE